MPVVVTKLCASSTSEKLVQSRTIYYKLPDGWKQAYLHYGIDGWAEQGHELMADAGNGWVKFTVDPKGKSFEYVFTDGGDNWDNPNGGGNYTAQGHWTAVADHEASAGGLSMHLGGRAHASADAVQRFRAVRVGVGQTA